MVARSTAWWIGSGLAITAAIPFAAPFDFEVSSAVARLDDRFAALVQDHGTHPALILYVAAIVCLAVPSLRRRSSLAARAASAVLVQALVHTMFAVNAIKFLWGRERFASVVAGHASFAPIWTLDPGSGGMSFPSGHVATALVLLPAALLLAREGKRWGTAAIVAGSALFAAAIAWGRLRFGAHYLTDVLFSAGTAVLFAPLSVVLGDRYLALFERAAGRVSLE